MKTWHCMVWKILTWSKKTLSILGVHIFYNKKIQDDLNFRDSIKNLVNVIRLWCMRTLTLEWKITIFKSLAISKIVHLALLTTDPSSVIEELKQIQKMFLWGNKKREPNMTRYVTNLKMGIFKMLKNLMVKN